MSTWERLCLGCLPEGLVGAFEPVGLYEGMGVTYTLRTVFL